MRQAVLALLGAVLTAGSCWAAGAWILQWLRLDGMLRRQEHTPLAFLMGASAVHLYYFAALALHLAYGPVIVAPLLTTLGWSAWAKPWRAERPVLTSSGRVLKRLTGSIAAIFLTIYFIYAWAPEHSPDGAAYHLGMIARQLRVHGMEKITTNLYAMLGQGVELIFLPAFFLGKHSAAALVHLCFGASLAWLLYAFGRRLGKPWAGATAAILTFASPVFGLDTSIAYIDAGTAAIVFATFYWLQIWDREREVGSKADRLLIAAGLMAGYAFAAKFTAFPIGVYSLGFVAWRARRLKPLVIVAGSGLLIAGPWVARNWLVYENPMAPLGTAIFRNPFTHVLFEQEYSRFLRAYGVMDKWTLPWEVTLRGSLTQGIIGPVFLLLPLGLLALRSRAGRQLWIAAVLVVATYPANVGTRFLIPALPFFSLLIAIPLSAAPQLAAVVMTIHAILSWPTIIPKYASEAAWRMERFPYKAALRIIPEQQFLDEALYAYPAIKLIEGHVPEGESVFVESGMPDSYTRREIRVSFQSASNETLGDIFNTGWQIGAQPIRAHIFKLPAIKTQKLRLEQTATAQYLEQWNIHELRFFSKGVELERKPEWRLQGWPNSWQVQLAFDNSPATRWRSNETPAPGMFMEVDFGSEQTVDEIRVETSPDSPSVRLQPERWTGSDWEKLPATLQSIDVPPNPNARRMATFEMAKRGARYILLTDNDWGSEDVRNDPASWALQEVGKDREFRLYRITW